MGLNKVGMGPNIAAHRDESSVHPDRTQGLVLRLEHGTGYATPNGRTGGGGVLLSAFDLSFQKRGTAAVQIKIYLGSGILLESLG